MLEKTLSLGSAKTAWQRIRNERVRRGLKDNLILAVDDRFDALWKCVVEHIRDDRRHVLSLDKPSLKPTPKGTRYIMELVLSQSIADHLKPAFGSERRSSDTLLDNIKNAVQQIRINVMSDRWVTYCRLTDILSSFDHKGILKIIEARSPLFSEILPLIERLLATQICGNEFSSQVLPRRNGISPDSPLAPICRVIALDTIRDMEHPFSSGHFVFRNDFVSFHKTKKDALHTVHTLKGQLAIAGLGLVESPFYQGPATGLVFNGYAAQDHGTRRHGRPVRVVVLPEIFQKAESTVARLIEELAHLGPKTCAEKIGEFIEDWRQEYGHGDNREEVASIYIYARKHLCRLFPHELPKISELTHSKLDYWNLTIPKISTFS